jgi:ADP-ribose pyrophosphatase YjhB (NUDIX family)/GNAT superfamily N-acetyltransferase
MLERDKGENEKIMPAKEPTYCPICAHELTEGEEGGRIRPMCDNCGYIHYVNPVPGVGLLIEMDGGVVLIQRGHPPHQGEWTLPSGFVEADESAEEAAIREAEEETGLKVEIIELANINSFPEGPPVSGIMIFYRMRPIGGKLQAGDDATAAKVFQPDEMPQLPFRTHREMMTEWLEKHTPHPSEKAQKSPAEIRIRHFAVADTEEVLALLMTIPINRNLTRDEYMAAALRMQELDNVQVYIAETGDIQTTIIGFAALTIVRGLTDSIGMISAMAVMPIYRRRGVGAKLLEAILRRASQLNLRALWVDKSRANDQARAFYAALGFDELDILRLKIR